MFLFLHDCPPCSRPSIKYSHLLLRLYVLRKASVSQRTHIKSVCMLFSCQFISVTLISDPGRDPQRVQENIFLLYKPHFSTQHDLCFPNLQKRASVIWTCSHTSRIFCMYFFWLGLFLTFLPTYFLLIIQVSTTSSAELSSFLLD